MIILFHLAACYSSTVADGFGSSAVPPPPHLEEYCSNMSLTDKARGRERGRDRGRRERDKNNQQLTFSHWPLH